MMKKNRSVYVKDAEYPALLAAFMNTKEGKAFTLNIMSQLVSGFEVNRKGKIENVVINDAADIKLDFE